MQQVFPDFQMRNRPAAGRAHLEEGAAFMDMAGLAERTGGRARLAELPSPKRERFPVIVIGGGQAGLSVGYHLARRGIPFVILDANERIGDSWRKRWDSLRLFSAARYDGLDGMPFPAPSTHFPTKDEMGNFLEAYAAHFHLPVRTGVRVGQLSRQGRRYVLTTNQGEFEAEQVVVAMANYQQPRVPSFAGELDRDIVTLHSADYRNPSQLRDGGVLIVGVGNSGAEIASELARHGHDVWLSGKASGEIPFRVDGFAGRRIFVPLLFRTVFHRVLTVSTPIGRKVRPKALHAAAPLIRVKGKHLAALGVERVGRTLGVRDGRPVLADGRMIDAANIVWCTGFHPSFSWIDLPVFNDDGDPLHERGIVDRSPGLYFVGLHFLYAFSSAQIHGVGRDAERVAATIEARSRTTVAPPA